MFQNNIDLDTLIGFLSQVDDAFPVPLSKKTDIYDYACKIHKFGKSLAYIDRGKVVGLALYYDNNQQSKTAYLSMLAVLKEYRSQGVASKLMDAFLRSSRHSGMLTAELFTHRTNTYAINLYKKFGFNSSTDEARPDDIKFSIVLD